MKKIILLLVLLLILYSYGFTQANSLPIVAVTNIEAVDVPAFVANACREMVETALIKTGKYQVMNYANMKEVLEAQSFSLSGCTDEACAVEIGKLLSAEQIVLGTLSGLDGKMMLSLRIIDVETGKHIAAEIVNIESMDTLQDNAFLGTNRLAGISLDPNISKESSTTFGEELKNEAYNQFLKKIDQLEFESQSLVDTNISTFPLKTEDLLTQMIDSKYTFPDLEDRADKLLIQSRKNKEEYDHLTKLHMLNMELLELKQKYRKEEESLPKRNLFKSLFQN